MSNVAALENKLNTMILEGKALDAFEEFYADDVVMSEPTGRREGKAANREYEQQFFASVKEFHGAEVLSSAVEGDVSLSEWKMDITFKDGNRVVLEQIARRRWQDGKVVDERFYYDA